MLSVKEKLESFSFQPWSCSSFCSVGRLHVRVTDENTPSPLEKWDRSPMEEELIYDYHFQWLAIAGFWSPNGSHKITTLFFYIGLKKKHSCKTQPPRLLRDKTAQQKTVNWYLRSTSYKSITQLISTGGRMPFTTGYNITYRWWQLKYFLEFSPWKLGKKITRFDVRIFQMGCFNHQPDHRWSRWRLNAGWQGGPHLEAICGGEVRSSPGFRSPLKWGSEKKNTKSALEDTPKNLENQQFM